MQQIQIGEFKFDYEPTGVCDITQDVWEQYITWLDNNYGAYIERQLGDKLWQMTIIRRKKFGDFFEFMEVNDPFRDTYIQIDDEMIIRILQQVKQLEV